MLFKTVDSNEQLEEKEQVRTLLERTSHEFVPPLTTRVSTTQTDLNKDVHNTEIETVDAYFEAILGQDMLLMLDEDDKLMGFVSFQLDKNFDEVNLPEPNCYVTTIIVSPEYRGRRLTEKLYRELRRSLPNDYRISCRTWTGNNAHIRVLEKLGFSVVKRVKDDRGAGVDTIWFSGGDF